MPHPARAALRADCVLIHRLRGDLNPRSFGTGQRRWRSLVASLGVRLLHTGRRLKQAWFALLPSTRRAGEVALAVLLLGVLLDVVLADFWTSRPLLTNLVATLAALPAAGLITYLVVDRVIDNQRRSAWSPVERQRVEKVLERLEFLAFQLAAIYRLDANVDEPGRHRGTALPILATDLMRVADEIGECLSRIARGGNPTELVESIGRLRGSIPKVDDGPLYLRRNVDRLLSARLSRIESLDPDLAMMIERFDVVGREWLLRFDGLPMSKQLPAIEEWRRLSAKLDGLGRGSDGASAKRRAGNDNLQQGLFRLQSDLWAASSLAESAGELHATLVRILEDGDEELRQKM